MNEQQKIAAERAAVMLAFAEGKKIERRDDDDHPDWEECLCPLWDWENVDYRVAPEPVELPELWAVFDNSNRWLGAASERAYADSIAKGHRNTCVIRYVPAPEEAPADKLSIPLPDGVPPVPEGFRYVGLGPLKGCDDVPSEDIAVHGSESERWLTPAWGDSNHRHYAVRIGSEFDKLNP